MVTILLALLVFLNIQPCQNNLFDCERMPDIEDYFPELRGFYINFQQKLDILNHNIYANTKILRSFGEKYCINNADMECGEDWYWKDTSCYLVVTESMTFDEAQRNCINNGANLTEITSLAEQDFIEMIIKTNQGRFWISGQQLVFKWIWIQSGLNMNETYQNWLGEKQINTLEVENCVQLMNTPSGNGKWKDFACNISNSDDDFPFYSICEKEPDYILAP